MKKVLRQLEFIRSRMEAFIEEMEKDYLELQTEVDRIRARAKRRRKR